MICFPGYYGIPTYEPIFQLLENKHNIDQIWPDTDYINPATVSLWWAKKELQPNKKISDYCGKNEKTKLIIKLMERGKGAPLAEPIIDKETHMKMLSYYHKKQEEQK